MAKSKKGSNDRVKFLLIVLLSVLLPLFLYLLYKPKPTIENQAAYLPDDGIAEGVPRIRIGGMAFNCSGKPMRDVYVAAI